MLALEQLKTRACAEIQRRRDWLVAICDAVSRTPEPGFREVKTSRLVAAKLDELRIAHRDGLAITGIKAILTGAAARPCVAVIGELDSLVVPGHPSADPASGAAHACGHNAQIAMLLGVAAGLHLSGVVDSLAGSIALIAAPAEEYIELEYRQSLREQGKIRYLGGKAELVRLGEFDVTDMAMMTHTAPLANGKKVMLGGTNNGTVAKQVQFIGKAAHAGGAPHQGVNALNAATIAMAAINAQRETFKDADTVRVHPIITCGGQAVNIVPSDVRLETFVRAKTMEAIQDADAKVDRALRAGALAVGAKVKITTLPGYMPLRNDPDMQDIYRKNALRVVGRGNIVPAGTHNTGSTDMGDISQIMPAIHPMIGGATGASHGVDYVIADPDLAVIGAAKIMAMTVIDLLADGAAAAKKVLARSKPAFTKAELLKHLDDSYREEVWEG